MWNPFKAIRGARLNDQVLCMERYADICAKAMLFNEIDDTNRAKIRAGIDVDEERLRVAAANFSMALNRYRGDVPQQIQDRLNKEGEYKHHLVTAERRVKAFLN